MFHPIDNFLVLRKLNKLSFLISKHSLSDSSNLELIHIGSPNLVFHTPSSVSINET